MDKIDLEILSYLRENARMKASDISKEINYSVSSVLEHIRKMERNGVIEKYTVLLNDKQLGNDLVAIMEVSLKSPKFYDDFCEIVSKNPNILSCYLLTGEFDFIIKIKTNSSENLEKIHTLIRSFEGVRAVKTHFALKEIKCEASVIPSKETGDLL